MPVRTHPSPVRGRARQAIVPLMLAALAFLCSPDFAVAVKQSGTPPALKPIEKAYFAVLDKYQRGDFAAAATEIRTWKERDLRLVLDELMKRRAARPAMAPGEIDARVKAASVMLHTEVSLDAYSEGGDGEGAFHLWFARQLAFSRDMNREGESEVLGAIGYPELDLNGFRSSWFLATVQSFTDILAHDVGRRLVVTGPPKGDKLATAHKRLLQSSDAQLLMAVGCLEEGSAFMEGRERQSGAFTGEGSVKPEDARRFAEAMFSRALEVDPKLLEARLRLGHVLLEQGRPVDAETQLRPVMENGDRRQRYLAALFLGSAAEAQRDPDSAAKWYRDALSIDQSGQAARIALAALLDRRGDRRAVADTLQPFVGRTERRRSEADPWTTYPRGEFEKAEANMKRLRQMVMSK